MIARPPSKTRSPRANRLEGLPTKGVQPIKRWDGKSGRVDLHLAVKAQEFDRTRHLVVALKAPAARSGA